MHVIGVLGRGDGNGELFKEIMTEKNSKCVLKM